MKQYQFTVTSQCIEAPKCAAFVSGSAEIYEAAFAFDASWDGFARTAVFECAGERREQLLVGDRCIVPWEILHAGAYLRVGVYGVDGNATMPTVYSGTMFVARGAEPSEAAREHSPDVFDQIVEIGGQVAEDAEAAAESAETATEKAGEAAQSATDAGLSKTAAQAAQIAAESAQNAAETAQSAAAASATTAGENATAAANSATNASTSATAADTAKTAAQNAATTATQQATAAAASASDAATSAQNASESATGAATSATAAENAKDAAIAALEAFHEPTATAQTLQPGMPATAIYDGQNFAFGIPQGVKGDAGKSAYQSAQDGGYTGTEQEFSADLSGVGDKYEMPPGGIPKTDLNPSVQESLESADSALQEVPIASDDTLGGIKVGSDFDIADDGTLSVYKALTLSASVSPSSAEMGSTIDDVTVSWTVNKTPVSQSVEGVDVPVADRSKALHDLGVTANRTFAVTAADARMSLTRNPGITFYRYVYSKVGSADAAPTQASECVKQADLSAFGNNGAEFSYSAGSTLWLLTTKANAQIETNVLGQWADVTTINAGTVEFTQANGAVVTYYAYNTGVFGGTGSAKYRIR